MDHLEAAGMCILSESNKEWIHSKTNLKVLDVKCERRNNFNTWDWKRMKFMIHNNIPTCKCCERAKELWIERSGPWNCPLEFLTKPWGFYINLLGVDSFIHYCFANFISFKDFPGRVEPVPFICSGFPCNNVRDRWDCLLVHTAAASVKCAVSHYLFPQFRRLP